MRKVIAGYGSIDSYTHQAFKEIIINKSYNTDYYECQSFKEVCVSVIEGKSDYGLLPLYNSSMGNIKEAVSAIKFYNLQKAETLKLSIQHALVGCEGSNLDTIQSVLVYDAVLKQCINNIYNYNLKVIKHHGTASAIKEVVKLHDLSLSAIGTIEAARKLKTNILCYPFNDNLDNNTTFGLFIKSAV